MTSPEGLTSREARRRLEEFGPNAVAEDTRVLGRALLAKFWAPVPWLLEAAIVLQVWLGQYVEAAVVGGLLAFNATLGVLQEGRASAALAALKKRTLNMLTKKIEIVLLLAIGLTLTGHAIMTPVLMVLMLLTNDFLSMSLTADRASLAPRPSAWHMRSITAAGLALGVCKLGFSTAMLAFGRFELGLGVEALQTWTFATLVFGNQALLYVLRERRRMWRSKPSAWVFASSVADIAIVVVLAVSGTLMAPLPWRLVVAACGAAAAFAVLLDQVKVPILSVFNVE